MPPTGVVRFALIESKFIPMMDYTGRPDVARAVENLYDRNSGTAGYDRSTRGTDTACMDTVACSV